MQSENITAAISGWRGGEFVRPDPEAVQRANSAAAARLYIEFLPMRRFLKVTTSARALAAAGVI
jgi:hypothetical protein